MKLKKTLIFGKIPLYILILCTFCIAYVKDRQLFIFIAGFSIFVLVGVVINKWLNLYFKWLEQEKDEARRKKEKW